MINKNEVGVYVCMQYFFVHPEILQEYSNSIDNTENTEHKYVGFCYTT